MAQTPRIVDIEKVVHGNKVKADFISAPFTQIVNEQGEPRKIPDLANNLKPSVGVERVMINGIKLLENEFGVDGRKVYSLPNRDPRIRFVGNWGADASNSGMLVFSATVDDYFEITFYGTGLNALLYQENSTRDHRASVDGGVEGPNLMEANSSDILAGRNYEPNTPRPVVSGLPLGIHTVKIRNLGAASNAFVLLGYEVLNESSQLTVNPGQPLVGGKSYSLNSQQLLDIKPSEIVGTKGARVVTYIDSDGNIGRSVQEVDATAQYLTNTDHSNEEIVRRVDWREFGRNRGDDFSSLGTNDDRAFTLDDGTTTLVGDNVRSDEANVGNGRLVLGSGGGNINFTFVGTGLDLIVGSITAGFDRNIDEIYVDGNLVGATTQFSSTEEDFTILLKICSGLPYGTHTVRLVNNAGPHNSVGIEDFLIYQPKKPSLPENVIELADYNVMADFVINAVADNLSISTGALRKTSIREHVYSGSGWAAPIDLTGIPGFRLETGANGDYVKYTFFGTGIEWRYNATNTNNANIVEVEIDDSTDVSSYTVDHYGPAGTSLLSTNPLRVDTSPTSGGAGQSGGLVVRDLPLGLHTIKVTKISGTSMRHDSFDVITPIHMNNSNLRVGNQSLRDLRNDPEVALSSSSIDLSKAKAWLVYDAVNDDIQSSYNISAVLEVTNLRQILVYFKNTFKNEPVCIASGSSTGVIRAVGVSDGTGITNKRIGVNLITNSIDNNIFHLVVYGELENEEELDLGDL